MINLNAPLVLKVALRFNIHVTLVPDLALSFVLTAAAGDVIVEADVAVTKDRFLWPM